MESAVNAGLRSRLTAALLGAAGKIQRLLDGFVVRAVGPELARSHLGNGVFGRCDGVDGGEVYGWAWRFGGPEPVEIEQWVDGSLRAGARADLLREDLSKLTPGGGAYGWRMPLFLDEGAQKVEIRIGNGPVLPGGAFMAQMPCQLRSELGGQIETGDLQARPAPESQIEISDVPPEALPNVIGYCDGVERGEVFGWAWRPRFPEEQVEIEQWVDGRYATSVAANEMRADLEALGVGNGRYGWRMRLALDADQTQPQHVELRIKNGPAIIGGSLALTFADVTLCAEDQAEANTGEIVGFYDGMKGSMLHGWARNVRAPDIPAEVELWVDGVHTAGAVADEFRPDLRSRGVGHGRYGFRLPISLDATRREPMQVEIRAKGGRPLDGGVFELRNDLALDDPANAALLPFVNSVLDPGPRRPAQPATFAAARTTLLVYCPGQREAGDFWSGEYDDYLGAVEAFLPVLRSLGTVVEVNDQEEAEQVCAASVASELSCLLLSFAPPRLAPLGLRCPVIPVFSWSFPTLPTRAWDRDPRSDWRYVLRHTGRAIVLSEFAADAVRATMGADYPVVCVPIPAFDRRPPASPAILTQRVVSVQGSILDTRDLAIQPEIIQPPPTRWPGGGENKRTLQLDGVVFTAALEMYDGRSNWRDQISAFAIGHACDADATLVVILTEAAPDWWRDLYRWVIRMPPFACRIVAIRGEMEEAGRRALIDASNWSVGGAKAEGFSLWRQALMSAGRPAMAPLHTAARDYLTGANAIIVASEEEAWTWPDEKESEGFSWTQHPDDLGPTTRHRVIWSSLRNQFRKAYDVSTSDTALYAAMSAAASTSMRDWCSDAAVRAKLDAFLGLNQRHAALAPPPSALLSQQTVA